MKTADFDFQLPPELIAQEPLPDRTGSRMMVLDRRSCSIKHRYIPDIIEYLRAGDLLVVNDTRVIPARLYGRRADTGGHIELLLIEECTTTVPSANNADREVYESEWECFYRASHRAKEGIALDLAEGSLRGKILELKDNGRIVAGFVSARPLCDILDNKGFAPVPPYIKRSSERNLQSDADRDRYQTVYANEPGAVAAPTAGLHFSKDLLRRIEDCGVLRSSVTLHVGPGTFKPVKAEYLEDHNMEEERFRVSADTAEALKNARETDGRVVAVGSTSVRTLETMFADLGKFAECSGRSSLFIYPPFQFNVVDIMLTNFHLPKSTLIMMVAAFASEVLGVERGVETVLEAYSEAIEHKYRFYSYGDCMLIV